MYAANALIYLFYLFESVCLLLHIKKKSTIYFILLWTFHFNNILTIIYFSHLSISHPLPICSPYNREYFQLMWLCSHTRLCLYLFVLFTSKTLLFSIQQHIQIHTLNCRHHHHRLLFWKPANKKSADKKNGQRVREEEKSVVL